MNCTSGCLTRDHSTWGECVRGKALHIVDPGGTGTAKKWDGDLQAYADAKAQGIQPSGIDRPSIDRAVRISQEDGTAFRG
jgi:hypothetical protein